jgi:hypothetical protein
VEFRVRFRWALMDEMFWLMLVRAIGSFLLER